MMTIAIACYLAPAAIAFCWCIRSDGLWRSLRFALACPMILVLVLIPDPALQGEIRRRESA